jgi:hypothetical protein
MRIEKTVTDNTAYITMLIDQLLEKKPITCYHSSTAEMFSPGSNYRKAFKEYTAYRNRVGACGGIESEEAADLMETFSLDHQDLLEDQQFRRFIFSMCTQLYLSYLEQDTEDLELVTYFINIMGAFLELGLQIKYWNNPKLYKYIRDVHTERGIINCLARETSECCTCMQPKKEETRKMEKVGMCHGCKNIIPKEQLRFCTGCNFARFCSKECHRQEWNDHKGYCKSLAKHNVTIKGMNEMDGFNRTEFTTI